MSTFATLHLLSHAVGIRSPHGISSGPQWVLDLIADLASQGGVSQDGDVESGPFAVRVSNDATLWGLVTAMPAGTLTTVWLEKEDADLFTASLEPPMGPQSGRTAPTG